MNEPQTREPGISAEKKQNIMEALFWFSLFLAMIIGMCAKCLYDYFVNNQGIDFRAEAVFRELLLPLVVSPMVFGAIYTFVSSSKAQKSIGTFIFAFQNGFFWKTIFGSVGIQNPQ